MLTVPSPWTVLPQKPHDLLPFFLLGKAFLDTLANISILALLCPTFPILIPSIFFFSLAPITIKINMFLIYLAYCLSPTKMYPPKEPHFLLSLFADVFPEHRILSDALLLLNGYLPSQQKSASLFSFHGLSFLLLLPLPLLPLLQFWNSDKLQILSTRTLIGPVQVRCSSLDQLAVVTGWDYMHTPFSVVGVCSQRIWAGETAQNESVNVKNQPKIHLESINYFLNFF